MMIKGDDVKSDKNHKLDKNEELMNDLQRTRADFENYRKNTENRVSMAQKVGEKRAILALIPVIDDIERAILHLPEDLKNNPWAQNVSKMNKNLEKNLNKLGVKKIDAKKGTIFNPEIHEAIQFEEDSEGENEIVAEELRTGYLINDDVLRPAMVKVSRK